MARGALISSLCMVLLLKACAPAAVRAGSIQGSVIDEARRPIAGAVVRVKATERSTITDNSGGFRLGDLQAGGSYVLTAWAPGYYIGGGEREILAGEREVRIILKKHNDQDVPGYEWVSAFRREPGAEGNCENCHSKASDSINASEAGLPFEEWVQDAHGLSASNARFLSMYSGQDLDGNQSPQTRYAQTRDYGSIPLRPDANQPYYGPGYKLDFPDTSGNCSACHAPAAAIDRAYETDPMQLEGVEEEGVTCDFCHKVWDVRLDRNGLPQVNMPGVLSFELRRPSEGHQFFAGPYDDVAPGEDTYTPIQRQSQFCAPCHFGSFWGTRIYNSFGEWLESPYSDPQSGKTCQDCHMPPGKIDHVARLTAGAVRRDPQSIFSHLMPGAASSELLESSVSMEVRAERAAGQVRVVVTIINDQAGHHVPTDSPLRQMILLVKARGPDETTLELLEGPRVPEWAGVGKTEEGYYAGQAGKGYAKVLMELWTEITPSGAYWNPTHVISDNRIPALGSDQSVYVFAAPTQGKVYLEVSLWFRRAYIELMDQKKWDVPDILMEQSKLEVGD